MSDRHTPAVLFDLDGTLTDPYEGITGCIRFAMERIGRPLAADADCRSHIGPPIQSVFRSLCETEDGSVIAAAIGFYRERFGSTGLYENRVYDGIPALLERLARDRALYVCTSKPTVYASRIVAHFGLAGFFRKVYGSELDGTRTDKAHLIAWLLERERLDASTTVMVGDRKHDALGARANGVTPYGALWGYGSEEELRAAGVAAAFATPADVARHFTGG
ncbi:MAG: phosphoglycolate phosphatase [Candidatus Eremiobacteraeota bacterium]|jgi:phosphoglycolate phosphatase|nr:phosphoglycolate phosphatase [Candidatus Eremiobacteraeota bacterium]